MNNNSPSSPKPPTRNSRRINHAVLNRPQMEASSPQARRLHLPSPELWRANESRRAPHPNAPPTSRPPKSLVQRRYPLPWTPQLLPRPKRRVATLPRNPRPGTKSLALLLRRNRGTASGSSGTLTTFLSTSKKSESKTDAIPNTDSIPYDAGDSTTLATCVNENAARYCCDCSGLLGRSIIWCIFSLGLSGRIRNRRCR